MSDETSHHTLSRVRERAGVRAKALRASSTDAERFLRSKLRDRRLSEFKFRRQRPIGPFIADFVCLAAKLVVECDGAQHFDDQGVEDDARRTAWLRREGWTVLRFSNLDVLKNIDGVLDAIWQWLDTHRPHPNPLPRAGEGASGSPAPRAGEEVARSPLPGAGEG